MTLDTVIIIVCLVGIAAYFVWSIADHGSITL